MKPIFFHIFFKYTVWNTRFQSLRCLGLKLTIFQALKSCAILPSKVVFELRGQNSTWQELLTSFWCQKINSVWRKVRQERDNEADIALLMLPISKVFKTDSSRRASAFISSPKIQLWEANRFNLSADIDTTLRIRHLRTRRFVLAISKNLVMRNTWPYSVAWRPKVLKWIGAWRQFLCQPGTLLFR